MHRRIAHELALLDSPERGVPGALRSRQEGECPQQCGSADATVLEHLRLRGVCDLPVGQRTARGVFRNHADDRGRLHREDGHCRNLVDLHVLRASDAAHHHRDAHPRFGAGAGVPDGVFPLW